MTFEEWWERAVQGWRNVEDGYDMAKAAWEAAENEVRLELYKRHSQEMEQGRDRDREYYRRLYE